MKTNVYFSQDAQLQMIQSFNDYMTNVVEKSYDQEKIIEWIESNEELLGDKKVWLLTGHAYSKTYDEWENWIIDNGYQVVVDCRGFGQVLIGEFKFHYNNLKKSLESKGVTVFRMSRD